MQPSPVLLVLLLIAAATADPVTLRGQRVELEPRFPTQRADLAVFRPVGTEIRLGDRTFPVEAAGKGIRVGKRTARGERTVKLGAVPVRFRPAGDGWEYAVLEAREFEVERAPFRLVDANGDGAFTVEGDAYQLPPSEFVLPLAPDLIIGRSQVRIVALEADGSSLDAEIRPLSAGREQLDAILRINALRASAGLPPTVVDETISAPCSAHARYLRIHKWYPSKMNPHFEVKGWRGYSDEGHRAAMMSIIAWTGNANAVDGHWITYYHRFPLLHPLLEGVGIGEGTPSISVIDGKTGTAWGDAAPAGWRDPILVPADGAVAVPKGFHRGGELPEPCENAGSRGFPLTVLFLAPDPGITAFRGTLVRIKRPGDEREVETIEPRAQGAGRRFGLIPERPLQGGTYRVRYEFQRHGTDETVTATFRTE